VTDTTAPSLRKKITSSWPSKPGRKIIPDPSKKGRLIELKDQTGRQLTLPQVPQRIISLVPSLTETLIDAGLESKLIGRTKFCIHPAGVVHKIPVTGGTKNPKTDKILALHPDLIIANKEENRKEDIDTLAQTVPVYVSNIQNLRELTLFMEDMATIFPQSGAAEIKCRFEEFPKPDSNPKTFRSCYLIWKDPWMTIGGDTFIHHMMEYAGFTNIFGNLQRYPEITLETLKKANPELILLSSEPYPFKQRQLIELQAEFPVSKIRLVDGEMFSWYGTRILKAPSYFEALRGELQ
jgi:ABC-type Fe3+-hydroxamate transport system substrate-binding protein